MADDEYEVWADQHVYEDKADDIRMLIQSRM
jgi:hypothetical protein